MTILVGYVILLHTNTYTLLLYEKVKYESPKKIQYFYLPIRQHKDPEPAEYI